MQRTLFKNKRLWKVTAGIFLPAVFLCFSFLGGGDIACEEPPVQIEDEVLAGLSQAAEEAEDGAEDAIAAEEVIYVDVRGCVNAPGVYRLPAGSRVFEAIALAGGMSSLAAPESVNQAALLSDEQHITVLSVEEYEKGEQAAGAAGKATTGVASNVASDGKVNLNAADSVQLQSLSGIGPSMAQRIIDYRQEHGAFQRVEDLQKVRGIGAKTFDKLKDNICI